MNIVSGLIIGTFAGAFACAATSQVIWLPIGLFLGAFFGELQTRRVSSSRTWAQEMAALRRRLRPRRERDKASSETRSSR